jgi:DNA-directed RNA polymerase II subunit RPB1
MSDDILDLKTNVSTAQSNITSLQSSVSTAQSNITSLQSSVSTAQSNITSLQSSVSSNTSSISTLSGNVSSLQTSVGSLQTDVTDLKAATLIVTKTSGTTYTFPSSVVQGQQIILINAQAATDVTVATTYTDAISSMVLTPGDKLTARGGTVSGGAKWLIGI